MAEYRQIKFQTNVPMRVKFPFNDCRRWVHEKYGESYTFTVEAEWTDPQTGPVAIPCNEEIKGSIRCSPFLMNKILSAGLGQGAEADVTFYETGQGNKKDYTVKVVTPPSAAGFVIKDAEGNTVDLQGVGVSGRVVDSSGSVKGMDTGGSTAPSKAPSRTIYEVAALYDQCVEEASKALRKHIMADVSDTTIQAGAATLFIQANKEGIQPSLDFDAKRKEADEPPDAEKSFELAHPEEEDEPFPF